MTNGEWSTGMVAVRTSAGLRAGRPAARNIAEDGDPDVFHETWLVQIWPHA
ncbi:hypothetical protein [Amycolatopsis sp. NBC_01286]|uniref:hypothetical protein n=1 Tax=Amycolatopsis sp. NBC_01286 TaxID=2903560 RepID=UPI002E167B1C|nr:hypothetical protein OG570_43580 [Amycolatopsis sp. NBC_01286]